MSLPMSVNTTYVSGTAPFVKSADLNALQSATVGLYNGTLSIAALVVDGTGNQAATPTLGNFAVTAAGAVTIKGGLNSSSYVGTPVIKLTGTTPSIAGGTGVGASPTISIAGTDSAGIITLSINNTPATSATAWTVTLASAFTAAATLVVVLTPIGIGGSVPAGTSAILYGAQVNTGGFPSGWIAQSGTAAASTGGPYRWHYMVSAF